MNTTQLAGYRARTEREIEQVGAGFAHGAWLALLLWGLLSGVLFLVLS